MKQYLAVRWLVAPLMAGLVLGACGDDKPTPGADVTADTTPDTVEPDTTPDTTEPDTTPDVAPDVAPDVPPDVPPDVVDPCAGKTLCTTAGLSCGAMPERIVSCAADADGCLVATVTETCDAGEACTVGENGPECVDPCADIPAGDVCETANARRCAGDVLETCTANADGCLAFSATSDCAAGTDTNACGAVDATFACWFDTCKGEADCTAGTTCDGDVLTTCAADAFGCAAVTTFDCADAGTTCDSTAGVCVAAEPCDGVAAELRCDTAGAVCSPDNVFSLWTCAPNAFGCLVLTATDCGDAAPEGQVGYCDNSVAGAAACKLDLEDRCAGKTLCSTDDVLGSNCNEAGTEVVTCAYDAVGCIVKTVETCAATDASFICKENEGDDACGPPCTDACVDGAVMCTENVISLCEVGASGCFEYTVAGDCASIGWVCAEDEGQWECVLPPPVVEVEPNGDCATATELNASGLALGALTPALDVDYYKLVLTEVADVRIETLNATFTACPGDTLVELLADDCTTVLVRDDDDGRDFCSLIDPIADAGAVELQPGTYYIRVNAYLSSTIAAYGLVVETGLPECGNGALERGEACDDGNDDDTDGCTSECVVQAGWSCGGSPSFCIDLSRGDTCDAAHNLDVWLAGRTSGTFGPFDTAPYTNNYGGFSNTTCPVNTGTGGTGGAGRDIVFSITVAPGQILAASMAVNNFDEFIALLNDCSAVNATTCLFADDTSGELRYTNTTGAAQTLYIIADGWGATSNGIFELQVSLRTPVCGDGIIEGAERCDGGAGGVTGCNPTTCQVEPGFICSGTPSTCIAEGVGNTCATAPFVTVGTYTGTTATAGGFSNTYISYAGACGTTNTPGNDVVYAIEVPNNQQLTASFTSTGFDGVLVLSSSCEALGTQCLDRVDRQSSNGTEVSRYTNTSGATQTIFVVLDGYLETSAGPYSLTLTLADPPVLESEPNGTCAEADTVNLNDRIVASINPGSDIDFFTFTLPEPRIVTIETAGADGIGSPCPGDTQINLYSGGTCATSVQFNDDGGFDVCSRIVRTLAAGTHHVRVNSYQQGVINNYSLSIITAPVP